MLTKRQIAEMLQVSTGTVDRWRRMKLMPEPWRGPDNSKNMGTLRWPLTEITEWLNKDSAGPKVVGSVT